MNTSPLEYLRSITLAVPQLNERLDDCLHRWGSLEIPPITFMFAEVGDVIAENISTLPKHQLQEIFLKIEEGINNPDTVLSTAVATGLIEALVSNADKKPELWREFEKLLGAASLRHAVAWRDFGR